MANSNNNEFKKRVYGLVIVKSKNSNFNADFTGNPRRLPDETGTIYATDKALKYAIRNYWVQQNKNVFVWKSFKKDKDEIKPRSLKERYNTIKQNKEQIEETFAKYIDIKLFGITFAMKAKQKKDNKNFSLTGACQISYGVNKLDENILFTNDILSPYRNDKDSDKEASQSTLGNETKSLEIYYVYDFSINPKNIISHYEDNEEIKDLFKITQDDINDLKEAFKYAVTNLDTASKKGSENALLLWIELPENTKTFLPELKDLVKITKNNEKVTINFKEIKGLLTKKKEINNIELYYNDKAIELENEDSKWKKEIL